MANHNAVTVEKVCFRQGALLGENVLQEQRCKNVRKHVTDVKRGKKPNQLKVRAKNIKRFKAREILGTVQRMGNEG